MNPRWLLLAFLLCGCGSTEAPGTAGAGGGGAQSTGGGEGSGTSGPDGCTGHDPSREAVCLSQGCQWGRSLLCSGVELPPEEHERPRPCACVCADDIEACARVP